MLNVRPLERQDLPDLGRLFASNASAAGCWCMWFIIRVKEYHEGGGAANAAKFEALADDSALPLGLIGYLDGEPVGWTAAGPRSRYVRAIKTPTLAGIDHAEDEEVWLVPCFFIRPDMRGKGIARSLLKYAVQLGQKFNANAIEGFPYSGHRAGSTDPQVGAERLFDSCGFTAIRTPSSKRVVMRLELKAAS